MVFDGWPHARILRIFIGKCTPYGVCETIFSLIFAINFNSIFKENISSEWINGMEWRNGFYCFVFRMVCGYRSPQCKLCICIFFSWLLNRVLVIDSVAARGWLALKNQKKIRSALDQSQKRTTMHTIIWFLRIGLCTGASFRVTSNSLSVVIWIVSSDTIFQMINLFELPKANC